ncbi:MULTISPECIES: triose-phosphate isomerase [Flavobacterium]|uniref:Triosephosphate isomerase n=2 Tax=Flavobacterium TaxID=237 RepID=A0A0A2LMP4_9FLAO|nr:MULTISPECIES: triose-phosphate isomerase [Flavobacterium]KGO81577.1 triosephosphate isomerase [Flavobacterium beibuense F44-8]MUV02237.1 triose-phosphate isomerase [Flavobacterium rakeshii]
MRKKIVAGNWKMNNDSQQTQALLSDILNKRPQDTATKIVVAPTFVNLQSAVIQTKGSNVIVAAQNMHQAESGAFTGEISVGMLKGIDVNTVILGHSERRAYFGETNSILAEKVNTALKHNLTIIFCFGEELADRQSGNHFNVVESQLREGLFHIGESQWTNVVLAYEPVWAIGTGETASPEQAQEMHNFIRTLIKENVSADVSEHTSILYGGSVKPDNAQEIFSKPDVDGGLIGGAALKADDFLAIVNAI